MGEKGHNAYKKSRWNVPWGSERQGLDKKEGGQESWKRSRLKRKGRETKIRSRFKFDIFESNGICRSVELSSKDFGSQIKQCQ
ncbi:hypothetical protein TNCV_3568181 [Trichonephila clavipes]|nr:hypothetical protein TNCV_3568181 [Trichonephila clavipes]